MGHGDNAFAAGPVGADDIAHAVKHKVIAVDIDTVAGAHPYIALHAVVLAKSDADNGHRHADVTEHHPPLAAGQRPQAAPEAVAMSGPFVNLQQGEDQHPQGHHQANDRHGGDTVL